jgi:hypothetical protein
MIKPLKSELKITENKVTIQASEIVDLRTVESDFVIRQLEEHIKQREMSIDKKMLKKTTE